ncbi:MAG: hypothetical protein CML57_11200 [Rhodobacteraceae bacterium]|mgnify:CR=1|nr:hypothetical protein [Paracoccaceae bacterium]
MLATTHDDICKLTYPLCAPKGTKKFVPNHVGPLFGIYQLIDIILKISRQSLTVSMAIAIL